MSLKILITGGTGFIGAYVIKELVQKGYNVRAIRRHNKLPFFIPASVFSNVEWVEGDILDVIALDAAMKGIDTVIHCAAKVSFNPSDKIFMYKTNIEGTANVVNLALDNNISRFVHVSSIAALGRTGSGDMVNEEKKWEHSKFNTQYAISKYHAEMEVWRAIGEGLNSVIINPSTVLGYGDWNTSSCAIFKNAYKEFPWYTNGINGFVDVEDVAKAAVVLMESNISGERFIVSSDNWSFHQLLSAIADGFHKKRPSKKATPLLAQLAIQAEKVKSFFNGNTPMLTKESARIAHSKTLFDNRKILQAFPGFSFIPLQQTIQKACEKYKLNLQSPELAK